MQRGDCAHLNQHPKNKHCTKCGEMINPKIPEGLTCHFKHLAYNKVAKYKFCPECGKKTDHDTIKTSIEINKNCRHPDQDYRNRNCTECGEIIRIEIPINEKCKTNPAMDFTHRYRGGNKFCPHCGKQLQNESRRDLMTTAQKQTDCPKLNLLNRGKVRDIYKIPDHPKILLMVATDRISAYDVIMGDPIPEKGIILTRLSLFWFDLLKNIVPNHLLSADVDDYPEICLQYRNQLEGRSMIVQRVKILPIECIVRGYISGSFWKAYLKTVPENDIEGPYKRVLGHKLPGNLMESDKFPHPLFTPSTKAEQGEHDENISVIEMQNILATWLLQNDINFSEGAKELAKQVEQVSIELYQTAADYAKDKGIIIADTKFELGITNENGLILVDEVLTPDSSRFWPLDQYAPGKGQPSFDKQFMRDYLQSLVDKGEWNKQTPAPKLPAEIAEGTGKRYEEALAKITG